jgi:hypothetical protein
MLDQATRVGIGIIANFGVTFLCAGWFVILIVWIEIRAKSRNFLYDKRYWLAFWLFSVFIIGSGIMLVPLTLFIIEPFFIFDKCFNLISYVQLGGRVLRLTLLALLETQSSI